VSGSWFGLRQQCGHRSSACCLDGLINETNWQSSLWESSYRFGAHNWKYISRPSRQQMTRIFTDPFTIRWNNAICNNMPWYTYVYRAILFVYQSVRIFHSDPLFECSMYSAIDIGIVVNQIRSFEFIYFKAHKKEKIKIIYVI